MLGVSARFAFAAVVLALTGCGATEPVTVEEGSLGTALVSMEELSPRAEVAEDSPEPCGPTPILESASEAAVSRTYSLGETRLKEAVGFFANEKQASKAFEELSSHGRSECIRDSVGRFSNGQEVEVEPLEPLGLGDPESLTRYLVTTPGVDAEKAVDVASMKLGLCVATIIVFQEDGSAEAARELIETAVQPAIDTCR